MTIKLGSNQYIAGEYQVAVIGGGHAGCEAALAAARMGMATVLNTSACGRSSRSRSCLVKSGVQVCEQGSFSRISLLRRLLLVISFIKLFGKGVSHDDFLYLRY